MHELAQVTQIAGKRSVAAHPPGCAATDNAVMGARASLALLAPVYVSPSYVTSEGVVTVVTKAAARIIRAFRALFDGARCTDGSLRILNGGCGYE